MARRILLLLSLIGAATVAHAHAHLLSSTPVDKSRVAAPAAVELKFSAAVRLTALTLQRGKESAKPLAPLPDKAGTSLSVPLPKLEAGDYVVEWRVASVDGHIMSGKVGFTVDPAAKPAAPAGNHASHEGMNMGEHSHADQAQHQH